MPWDSHFTGMTWGVVLHQLKQFRIKKKCLKKPQELEEQLKKGNCQDQPKLRRNWSSAEQSRWRGSENGSAHIHRNPWKIQNLVTFSSVSGLTRFTQETLTLKKQKTHYFTSEINQIFKAIWAFYFCLECVAMQLREASAPSQWLPWNFHPIHFIVLLDMSFEWPHIHLPTFYLVLYF